MPYIVKIIAPETVFWSLPLSTPKISNKGLISNFEVRCSCAPNPVIYRYKDTYSGINLKALAARALPTYPVTTPILVANINGLFKILTLSNPRLL
ncbi:MAG: hypothetical protein AAB267_01120 [Candidatus Desantisbacteria bacterium]